MQFTHVTPTGYSECTVYAKHDTRHWENRVVSTPIYPVNPQRRIKGIRKDVGIRLRDAAKLMGITAVQLSSLERGEIVYADGEEFALAIGRLMGMEQR